MLLDFANQLEQEYPEAALELCRPACNASEAESRAEVACRRHAEVLQYDATGLTSPAYQSYCNRYANVLGVSSVKAKTVLESDIPIANIAGACAILLLAGEGVSHAASAIDAKAGLIDGVLHGLDLTDAVGTLGLSIAASLVIKWYFNKRNRESREQVDRLFETVILRGRLARHLMSPNRGKDAHELLQQLNARGQSLQSIG